MLVIRCRKLAQNLEKGDMGAGKHVVGLPKRDRRPLEHGQPTKEDDETVTTREHELEEADADEEARKIGAGADASEKKELNRI